MFLFSSGPIICDDFRRNITVLLNRKLMGATDQKMLRKYNQEKM